MHDEELILNIIKNSNEAIIAIDLDGKVMLWNRAAENLFGYTEEEVKGKFLPLVKNKASYELETIITKTKEGKSLNFRTQKQDRIGNEFDLIFHTNPIHKNNVIIGAAIIIQQSELLKKVSYLSLNLEQTTKEPKRTFLVIRDLILLTINYDKKTINQISSESGINWRTVEKHLTFLIGKKLVAEIFSSEYVRIFELTAHGRNYLDQLKKDKQKGDKKI